MNRVSFIAACLFIGMLQVVFGAFLVFLFMSGPRHILHGSLLSLEFWYHVLNFPFGMLLNFAMVVCLFATRFAALRYLHSPSLAIILPAAVFVLLYILVLVEGGFFIGFYGEIPLYTVFCIYLLISTFLMWHRLARYQSSPALLSP